MSLNALYLDGYYIIFKFEGTATIEVLDFNTKISLDNLKSLTVGDVF